MLVALAAALLVAAQVASATMLTTAQLHAEVAENLKGFSVQCGADLGKRVLANEVAAFVLPLTPSRSPHLQSPLHHLFCFLQPRSTAIAKFKRS